MVKEKRILSYFIGWLIVGFCILFIGINNVFAATYDMNREYLQQYYDNRGSSVVAVNTTWNESLLSYISDNITTVANSYGAGLSISSPIPILENHTYTLSIYFPEINNVTLSSKNHIAISTGLSGAATNYANGNYYVDMVQSNVNSDTILQFVFTAKGHGSFIFIPWTTKYNTIQDYVLTQITMEDLGSEGVSINDINSSLSNQTNTLNNSIQNSTDTITGEINDMEQSIIDSNKETQDVIKDQFNDCRPSYNLLDLSKFTISNAILNSNNTIISNINNQYYINLSTTSLNSFLMNNLGKSITFSFVPTIQGKAVSIVISGNRTNGSTYQEVSFGSTNYVTIEIANDFTSINKIDIRLNRSSTAFTDTTTVFSNLMLNEGSTALSYEPYGKEICSNRLDETNDKLNDLQSAITDSSAPNTSGLENSTGWLPAGPLDSVLNLPLSLFNALTTNLNKSCNAINIPLPYVNKNITLPCINTLYNQIGITSFLSWIGVIVSGLMLYTYLLKLYKWIEDRISLNETHNVDSWGGL